MHIRQDENLREQEKTRKSAIRQKAEENQKKKTNNNGFGGIVFLRVTHLGNDSSDSDDDRSSIREATLNIRECLPS